MGIRLLEGSVFRDARLPGETPVIIVSQSFARAFLPGESALGQQVRTGGAWQTVIGVVSDVRLSTLEEKPRPTVYGSFWGAPDNRSALAIRSTLPAEQVIAAIRDTLRGIDPAIGLEDVATMDQRVSEAIVNRRFQTVVLAVFAIFAVLLALVGLYGLLAYAVRQRTAELGIRMALGASAARLVVMIVRQGLGLVTIGLIAGVIGAFALTRILATWVYGVTTTDPLTFVAVPLSIFAVALIACLIPAWRATRIDPLAALRYE